MDKKLHLVCIFCAGKLLLNTNEQLFSYILERTNSIRWDADVHFALDQQLSLNFIVLAINGNNSLRLHVTQWRDTLSRFQPNNLYSFSFMLSEKQQFLILYSGLTWMGLAATKFCTRCELANHYIIDPVNYITWEASKLHVELLRHNVERRLLQPKLCYD